MVGGVGQRRSDKTGDTMALKGSGRRRVPQLYDGLPPSDTHRTGFSRSPLA